MALHHMMRGLTLLTLLLTGVSCAAAPAKKISAHTSTPLKEAGVINTAGWVDSPYITPDGKHLYYMYSRYNFFPVFLDNKQPVLQGPNYAGHHNNDINPYWDSDIYISHRQANGSWSAPQNLAGVNDERDNCCAMVVAGPPERIYFQKETPDNGLDIVYKERRADGSWGEIVFLPPQINSSANEDNIHVSPDSRRFYFSSTRPGGRGDKDIWFSYLDENGKMSDAVNLGPMINTGEMEDQFWIADKPDPQGVYEVYFNRTGSQIWRSTWNEKQGFSEPAKVDLGFDSVGEASVTADGQELYFAAGDISTRRIGIMVSRRAPNGYDWEKGHPVD